MYAILLNNLLAWSIIVASVGAAILVGFTLEHFRQAVMAQRVQRVQRSVRSTPRD